MVFTVKHKYGADALSCVGHRDGVYILYRIYVRHMYGSYRFEGTMFEGTMRKYAADAHSVSKQLTESVCVVKHVITLLTRTVRT